MKKNIVFSYSDKSYNFDLNLDQNYAKKKAGLVSRILVPINPYKF